MSKKQDFDQIANALEFIADNFKKQPSIPEIAKYLNVSESHFQRILKKWPGISQEVFTVPHSKRIEEFIRKKPQYS